MLNIIIVIYNKSCIESRSIQFLKKKKIDTLKINIFDNSEIDYGNEQYCYENGFTYYTFHKNMGLSFAYNYIIEKIDDKDSYILILDDDTEINDEFIREILFLIEKKIKKILLPIVKSNNIILSPSIVKNNIKSTIVRDISEIIGQNLTAINSGMVIPKEVFNKIQYNENLFLDCIDHAFLDQVKKEGYPIKILNSIIFQDYSRDNLGLKANTLKRFIIYKKDFKKYCVMKNKLCYYYCSIFKLGMKYSLYFKDFDFLKIYK